MGCNLGYTEKSSKGQSKCPLNYVEGDTNNSPTRTHTHTHTHTPCIDSSCCAVNVQAIAIHKQLSML